VHRSASARPLGGAPSPIKRSRRQHLLERRARVADRVGQPCATTRPRLLRELLRALFELIEQGLEGRSARRLVRVARGRAGVDRTNAVAA
jgi:hypothetical protein